MFSSLASLIFGSYSPATTNPELKQEPHHGDEDEDGDKLNFIEDQLSIGNTIEVTSRTPSVTGTNPKLLTTFPVNSRPGKNKIKGNKSHHQHQNGKKHHGLSQSVKQNNNYQFGDINDDEDWVLVEKENYGEEDLTSSVAECIQQKPIANNAANKAAAPGRNHHHQHQQQHHHNNHQIHQPLQQKNPSHHSVIYSGHQRRLKSIQSNNSGLSASHYNIIGNSDGAPTQSLYVVSSSADVDDHNTIQIPAKLAMEESWFLTPPPCFTSTGPVNMEISPFENLLIEHPSMSVYHSIRSAQETTESFVNIDLGVEESQQIVLASSQKQNRQVAQSSPSKTPQHRSGGHRADRFSTAQIKQELLARNTQKTIEKQKRQSLCRSAIMRSNKVREFCSNGNRPRRSDLQHCRILSRANNNRKC